MGIYVAREFAMREIKLRRKWANRGDKYNFCRGNWGEQRPLLELITCFFFKNDQDSQRAKQHANIISSEETHFNGTWRYGHAHDLYILARKGTKLWQCINYGARWNKDDSWRIRFSSRNIEYLHVEITIRNYDFIINW